MRINWSPGGTCHVLAFIISILPHLLPAQAGSSTAPTFQLLDAGTLPAPTMMHGAAVVGSHLYILGGNIELTPGGKDGGWTNRCWSAEILPTGNLSKSWRSEPDFPDNRAYIGNSIQVVNNRLYVVGGATYATSTTPDKAAVKSRDVLWTTVSPNGSLAPWKRSIPFPSAPLSNAATASTEKFLYVLGGYTDDSISTSILMARLDREGAPVDWRVISTLPIPLWFSGSAILEDKLYVWGGLSTPKSDSVNSSVFSSRIGTDGQLSPWVEEIPPQFPVYSSCFTGFNDYIISVAGRYKGGIPTNAIWFSRLDNNRCTEWQFLNTDLEARLYSSLGLDKSRGWVYITGGVNRTTVGAGRGPQAPVVATVQAFQLSQPASKKLDLSAVPPAAQAGNVAGTGNPPSTIAQGLKEAGGSRQVLVFLYSPEVPASRRVYDDVVNTERFRQLTSGMVVVRQDVSRSGMSECSRFNIFRVPAFLLLDATATKTRESMQVRTIADLEAFLASGN